MIAGALASGSIKNVDIAGTQRASLGGSPVKAGNREAKSTPSEAGQSSKTDQGRFDDVLKRQKPAAEDAPSSKAQGDVTPSIDEAVAEVAQESPEHAQESSDDDSPPAELIASDASSSEVLIVASDPQPVGSAAVKKGPSAVVIDPRGAIKLPVVQGDPQSPRVVSPHQGNDRPDVAQPAFASSVESQIEGEAGGQSEQQGGSGERKAPTTQSVIAEGQLNRKAGQQAVAENGVVEPPEGQQQVLTTKSTQLQEPTSASQRSDAAADQQPRSTPTEVPQTNLEAPKSEASLQLERVLEAPTVGKSNTASDLKQASSMPSKPQVDPAAQIVSRGLSAAVAQRGGSVTMQLIPETLGQVRVQMHLEHGVVSVRIETANAAAQSLLNDNLTMLRTSLESKGLLIERLSVHFSPQGLSAGTAHSAGTNGGHEPGQGGPQSQLGGQNHNAAGQGSRGNGGEAEQRARMGEAELPAESGTSDEAMVKAQFGSTLRLRLHAVA